LTAVAVPKIAAFATYRRQKTML